MTDIAKNLLQIQNQVAAAAARAGRDPSEVTLVAVSKRHPVEAIVAAYEAGQRDFGENYAQELKEKAEALVHLPDILWHFIGHLQRNKVKYVVPTGCLTETVDSARLADELNDRAHKSNLNLECLVQVNVGEEEQKSGCAIDDAEGLIAHIESLSNLNPVGLMTIPPFDLDASETQVHFKALAALRKSLGGKDRLPHLSMGMSHDFVEAIEEGATIVRVGTAIFGVRPPRR